MKVHKRFYSAIPRPLASSSTSAQVSTPVVRVRSNSACSSRSLYTAPQAPLPFPFFDAPPPTPSTRPGSGNYVVSSRLAAEAKVEVENHSTPGQSNAPQQSQHGGPLSYSLVFTPGSSQSSLNANPVSPYSLFYPYSSFGSSPLDGALECNSETTHPSKRPRTRYHLDVGAYGIPKHSRNPRAAGRGGQMNKPFTSSHSLHDGSQAVQVGEDAYFIRGNAMGIADGVGGWAKSRGSARTEGPSPSALFAHRLMQYCCEEVIPSTDPHGLYEASSEDTDYNGLSAELDDSLEDLADGLDVLMVLERAYDKTLKAHVMPPSPSNDRPCENAIPKPDSQHPSSAASSPLQQAPSPQSSPRSANSPIPESPPAPDAAPAPKPLMEGSSTALLAILDHASVPSPKPPLPASLLPRQLRHTAESAHAPTPDRGAVLRIAHLGDCMAMLIRDDEIVWRTEEMWWDFNTPVQLGPASPTRPRDAQVCTVPVQADDILVLASDGLSDNLWDEDILDEALRFRRSFMADAGSGAATTLLRRSTLAGMLSEALCSRARCVSERRGVRAAQAAGRPSAPTDEIPFARRARELGKWFDGGKPDDICVLVAVVSPSDPAS